MICAPAFTSVPSNTGSGPAVTVVITSASAGIPAETSVVPNFAAVFAARSIKSASLS